MEIARNLGKHLNFNAQLRMKPDASCLCSPVCNRFFFPMCFFMCFVENEHKSSELTKTRAFHPRQQIIAWSNKHSFHTRTLMLFKPLFESDFNMHIESSSRYRHDSSSLVRFKVVESMSKVLCVVLTISGNIHILKL